MTSSEALSPLPSKERLIALDTVRGLAVLGILVMNIVEFAWPFEAYENPAYAGGSTGADLWAWYLQTTLFDGKMRALFSMLFGAGLVLIAQRMEAQGRSAGTADLLLRRCLWLVPFGIAHRFLLQWSGDILYQYGLLGLVAVAFRHLRARSLVVLGIVTLTAFVPIGLWGHAKTAKIRDQAAEATRLESAGETVPAELAQAKKRWTAKLDSVPPKAETLEKEIAEVQGSWPRVFANRWDYHHTFQSAYLYYYFVWDVLGMMFLGMGLMKCGYFAGRVPTTWHVVLIAVGAATAIAIGFWGKAWQDTGFSAGALGVHTVRQVTYAYSRALVGLAWASGLLLVLRAGILARTTNALAAVGRLAFSNYVLQTICCTLLFFGYGFGLYGKVPRAWLMAIVLGVSLVQIVFSLLWLRWFRFGPLEWAWRSLTYGKRQPFLRAEHDSA